MAIEQSINQIIESVLAKQDRYKKENGKDLIDEWEERYTIEEFRLIMTAVCERYTRRLGQKDDPVQELTKVLDYTLRMIGAELRFKNSL